MINTNCQKGDIAIDLGDGTTYEIIDIYQDSEKRFNYLLKNINEYMTQPINVQDYRMVTEYKVRRDSRQRQSNQPKKTMADTVTIKIELDSTEAEKKIEELTNKLKEVGRLFEIYGERV